MSDSRSGQDQEDLSLFNWYFTTFGKPPIVLEPDEYDTADPGTLAIRLMTYSTGHEGVLDMGERGWPVVLDHVMAAIRQRLEIAIQESGTPKGIEFEVRIPLPHKLVDLDEEPPIIWKDDYDGYTNPTR